MSVQQNIYRQRHSFSKIRSLVPIPNLIDIQKRSYDEFLQMNLLHGERENRRGGGVRRGTRDECRPHDSSS